MKISKNHIIIPVLVLMIVTGAVSCKKSFFTDVNDNPNAPRPEAIVPANLLPTVEAALAYTIGGDYSRYTALLTQQATGVARQAQGYGSYIFTSQDFDQIWANFYTAVMENNKTLMQLADAKGYHAYSGVSRVIMAYSLMMVVDAWGSVPYSQAFKGVEQFQAAYDNDKALYDTVAKLVDDGIALLSDADPGALFPQEEDFIYGGAAEKWIKFAHAIKARMYIHQSKGDAGMAAKALDEANQSFSSNADNAQYIFGTNATSANPWYQYNNQRGDISFANGYLPDQLTTLKDPRQAIWYDNTNDALLFYGNVNAPVELITYDEMQFVKAEATLRSTGNVAAAQSFYREGIRANMEKLGVSSGEIEAYIGAHGNLPSGTDAAIAQVAFQEYIALYLNPEAWTLWRRTGVPALTPTVGNNVPRRLLYPQSELAYNKANVPPQVTLYAPRVFWDK